LKYYSFIKQPDKQEHIIGRCVLLLQTRVHIKIISGIKQKPTKREGWKPIKVKKEEDRKRERDGNS
jgi:hypothetical protein